MRIAFLGFVMVLGFGCNMLLYCSNDLGVTKEKEPEINGVVTLLKGYAHKYNAEDRKGLDNIFIEANGKIKPLSEVSKGQTMFPVEVRGKVGDREVVYSTPQYMPENIVKEAANGRVLKLCFHRYTDEFCESTFICQNFTWDNINREVLAHIVDFDAAFKLEKKRIEQIAKKIQEKKYKN
jgi:hypothetical protein